MCQRTSHVDGPLKEILENSIEPDEATKKLVLEILREKKIID